MGAVLVFGLSGQLGEALLPRLLERHEPVLAVSRQAREALPGVDWLHGSLQAMPDPPGEVETIISVGPLDAFAEWFARSATRARVIAIGSTGVFDKLHSADPAEHALAQSLARAESLLFSSAAERGAAVTLLRPTLLYGNGRDTVISPLLDFGRRRRFIPLPSPASGLRQPVHVDDVAGAIVSCLGRVETAGQSFNLPGGETLAFDAMLRRACARHAPGCRVLVLPRPLFALGNRLAPRLGLRPVSTGSLGRLGRDQVVDLTPASHAFGYAPRRFAP